MTLDLTDPASYDFWVTENVRFSDTDLVGHVNNVAHTALVESIRIPYARHLATQLDADRRPAPVPDELRRVFLAEIDAGPAAR